jgi:hypothetical protein
LFVIGIWLADQVTGYGTGPNANIPGSGSLMDFVNTMAHWGLIFAVLGVFLSAAVFAAGRTVGNAMLAMGGIAGLATSGVCAALIGGAAIWVNHLVNFGAAWH